MKTLLFVSVSIIAPCLSMVIIVAHYRYGV